MIIPKLREAGLLGLVAVVTYLTASNSIGYSWTPIEAAATDDRWSLLPVAGAVLVALLRLRWPALAVLAAAAQFGWWPVSGAALALTAFEVAGRIERTRRRVIVLGLACVIGYPVSLLVVPHVGWVMMTVLHVITATVCVVLPAWARTLLGQAERVLRGLRERAQHLEVTHATAHLQERARIAQEMHDQLGHRLSLISLYAGALELDHEGGEATLIRSTAQTAMQELRETLGLLRPAASDAALRPATESGLRTDIARLVVESRSAGVDVTLTWHGEDLDEVATPVRRALQRIVREGLTNVHRHAHGAPAAVVVEHGADSVRVEIVNDRGAPSRPGGGLGLVGVRERVRLLGGEIACGPTRDGGFRLAADLPCRLPAPVAPIRQRRGSSAVLAAGLVGVAALVIVALTYLPWYAGPFNSETEPPPPKVISLGMRSAEVLPEIGADEPVTRLAASAVEKPPPAGSTCVYTSEYAADSRFTILRYCFRADVLIAIDRYPVNGTYSAVGP